MKKNKIILRKFTKSDSVKLFKWARDPALIKYIGSPESSSAEEEYQRLLNKVKNFGRIIFIIEAKERKPIGYVYIDVDEKNKKAEFSIAVGEKDYWGKGYGTESVKIALDYIFDQLKLNRVFLKVLTFNLPAIKLYKKFGFKKEGTLREDVCLNGKYKDFIIMGLLKKEYENKNR